MDNKVENLVRMIDEAFAQGKVVDFVRGGLVSNKQLSTEKQIKCQDDKSNNCNNGNQCNNIVF